MVVGTLKIEPLRDKRQNVVVGTWPELVREANRQGRRIVCIDELMRGPLKEGLLIIPRGLAVGPNIIKPEEGKPFGDSVVYWDGKRKVSVGREVIVGYSHLENHILIQPPGWKRDGLPRFSFVESKNPETGEMVEELVTTRDKLMRAELDPTTGKYIVRGMVNETAIVDGKQVEIEKQLSLAPLRLYGVFGDTYVGPYVYCMPQHTEAGDFKYEFFTYVVVAEGNGAEGRRE